MHIIVTKLRIQHQEQTKQNKIKNAKRKDDAAWLIRKYTIVFIFEEKRGERGKVVGMRTSQEFCEGLQIIFHVS